MTALRYSAIALAIGLAAAPQAHAQTRSQSAQVLVCRNGRVTSARYGMGACDRDGGIDANATAQARRNTVYGQTNGDRGVYNGGVNNGSTNTNRGVYNGGVYGSRYPNGSDRTVYGTNDNRNGRIYRDDDDDDRDGDRDGGRHAKGEHGRGHAYGHYKAKHNKGKGHDRD